MTDQLATLFGSQARLKLIKLFVFNPGLELDLASAALRAGGKLKDIEKDLAFFEKLGMVRKKKVARTIEAKKGKKTVIKKLKVPHWSPDPSFKLAEPLADFLVRTQSLEHKAIVRRIEKAGRVKAVIVSGIFMRNAESSLDLFIVADNIDSSAIGRVVKGIEADLGKDIRYAVLSAADYSYRASMNDKLVRDVMDYPHTVLVDKIGISNA